MSDVKPTCHMCQTRPAKKMTAVDREGATYINAQDVVMFCSVKCAANYALLWGAPAIEQCEHFCPVAEKWVRFPQYQCGACGAREERQREQAARKERR